MSSTPETFDFDIDPEIALYTFDQDPVTYEYMHAAQSLAQLVNVVSSAQQKQELISAFNTEWHSYDKQQVIIAGIYHTIHEGRVIELNIPMRTYGYFQGIGFPVDEYGTTQDELAYLFSSDPASVQPLMNFYADTTTHLEFPHALSQNYLNQLAAPIYEVVDEVIFDESHRSFVDILQGLKDLAVADNIKPHTRNAVYTVVAEYLNDAIDMGNVIGVSAMLDGAMFGQHHAQEITAQGKHVITDPFFFFHVEGEQLPELCIAGEVSTRGGQFSKSLCAVPLSIMTQMSAIERAPADER